MTYRSPLHEAIHIRIKDLREHLSTYSAYCATCDRLGDRHGVIDAQCEMRELEARLDELTKVLGY